MEKTEILTYVDHTLLARDATPSQITELCRQAEQHHCASVCIPPSLVRYAKEEKERHGWRIPLCTVIGFPMGYSSTKSKCDEAANAICDGAEEIDMVISLGDLKGGRVDLVTEEIRAVKAVCGNKVLKVIVESSLLTEAEKRQICEAVIEGGADFIKTSTGFFGTHATVEDVRLFSDVANGRIRVKASGGIGSFDDAAALLAAGASRLGTSRLVSAMEGEK